MKKIVIFFAFICLLVQCKRNHLEPVPIIDDIFLFDTLDKNSIYYSPDSNKVRSINRKYSFLPEQLSIVYSSDIFFRYKYLYLWKKVYPPYELDHYIYTKDSLCYYELNVFFKNNELDSVSYMRVSVKHRFIDGNLLGEKLFPVSKNAAIDTLKKWGFIDEQLHYIIPSLKKR